MSDERKFLNKQSRRLNDIYLYWPNLKEIPLTERTRRHLEDIKEQTNEVSKALRHESLKRKALTPNKEAET